MCVCPWESRHTLIGLFAADWGLTATRGVGRVGGGV